MRSLLLLLAVLPAIVQAQPVVQLSAGMHLIRAELAADMATRSRGLMFRKSLAPNAGMVFVFDEASQHCMWMKNTLIPLSVAFVDEAGIIINIEDMAPQTEDTHCAKRPARYALEMDRGWFASRGIKPGTKLGGIDKLRP
jgi:uncharacterized membrane protein (UPF0127 family)